LLTSYTDLINFAFSINKKKAAGNTTALINYHFI
jgi:hypothetical protein